MKTAQDFYHWLFVDPKNSDPYQQELVQLTRIDPGQMAVLQSDLGWEPWDAREPETINP